VDQSAVKGADICQQLLLNDNGALVFMDELNRVSMVTILQRRSLLIQIDHVIESRGLARAGRTRDEHEAVWPAGEVVDFFGQPKPFAGGDAVAAKNEAHFGMTIAR